MGKRKNELFYEVIMDDSTRTFEIVGKSVDDTKITFLICDMQKVGMKVRCQTAYGHLSEAEIEEGFQAIGYSREDGLYSRLLGKFSTLRT